MTAMASAKTNLIRIYQLACAGFLVSSLFGRGLYVEFLYLAALALLVLSIFEPVLLRQMHPLRFLLFFAAILAVEGSLAGTASPEAMPSQMLLLAVLAVACIYLLPTHLFSDPDKVNRSLVAVLAIFVTAQTIGCVFGKIDSSLYTNIHFFGKNDSGLYTNIHFLSLYAAITLPLLIYLGIRTGGILRVVVGITMVVDLMLLLKTQSRPAWLALLVGSIAVIPLLHRSVRAYALAGLLGLPLLLYLTGLFGVAQRVDSLLLNLAQEERVFIWQESWAMQRVSHWPEWVFGHGFGSFYHDYLPYSSFRAQGGFVFPHNFLLEILYVNGIFGVIWIILGYAYLLRLLLALAKNPRDVGYYRLAVLLMAVTIIHFVHTFLTVPFYSKYTLITLAIILGVALKIHHPPVGEGIKPVDDLRQSPT